MTLRDKCGIYLKRSSCLHQAIMEEIGSKGFREYPKVHPRRTKSFLDQKENIAIRGFIALQS
jgi:hypothetical protein